MDIAPAAEMNSLAIDEDGNGVDRPCGSTEMRWDGVGP